MRASTLLLVVIFIVTVRSSIGLIREGEQT